MPYAALAGIIGAGISAAASLAGTHMRNEAQKSESELAYRREQQAIKEQNAFNSPSAQMARMQAAGLNPNLMYEQGEQGLQSDIPRYQPADIDNAVEPLGNAGQQIIQNLVGLKDLANKTALANSQILVNASTRDFNASQAKLSDAQCERITALLGWEIKGHEVGLRVSEANIKDIEARIKGVQSQIEVNDKNIEYMTARIHVSRAEFEKLDAETQQILLLAPAQKDFLEAGIAERRLMVEKMALDMKLAKQENIRGWISVGVKSVTEIAGTVAKFLGKGASLNNLFGSSPWEQNLSPNVTGPNNDFMDFLPGD